MTRACVTRHATRVICVFCVVLLAGHAVAAADGGALDQKALLETSEDLGSGAKDDDSSTLHLALSHLLKQKGTSQDSTKKEKEDNLPKSYLKLKLSKDLVNDSSTQLPVSENEKDDLTFKNSTKKEKDDNLSKSYLNKKLSKELVNDEKKDDNMSSESTDKDRNVTDNSTAKDDNLPKSYLKQKLSKHLANDEKKDDNLPSKSTGEDEDVPDKSTGKVENLPFNKTDKDDNLPSKLTAKSDNNKTEKVTEHKDEHEASGFSGDSASDEKDDNLPAQDDKASSQDSDDDTSLKGPYNYTHYQPYEKMVEELKRISESDDKEVKKTLLSIGTTFENRTLWAMRLEEVGVDKVLKKTIFIDCGAHAREWIAPSTCMWLINELTTSKGSLRDLLKKYDWVFVPLLNPDGYVFTWEKDNMRLWRKNRSFDDKQLKKYKETGDPMCIGVDINRNFNKTWGGVGAPTDNPCDETYAGSEAFSEKESKALAKYLRSIESDVIAYVTLHCYGQLWMTPWGFTSSKPRDYKELKRVAELAVDAMKERSGVKYTIGPSHDVLYSHSGTSADWVYSKLDIPYTYVVEMIPKVDSASSFELPASAMVKNSKDITVGIRTMAENLKEGQQNHENGVKKSDCHQRSTS